MDEAKPPEGFNHSHDLQQDSSNSSVLAMELLQSCAKPSISGYGIAKQISRSKNSNS